MSELVQLKIGHTLKDQPVLDLLAQAEAKRQAVRTDKEVGQ